MRKGKNGPETEKRWQILTFVIILAAFTLIISGIYAENMELCKIIWLILMAVMLLIPLRRHVFVSGAGKEDKKR